MLNGDFLKLYARLQAVIDDVIKTYGGLRLRTCGGLATGFMVAVEGVDGAGVSTHSTLITEFLSRIIDGGKYRVVLTKEPTKGPLGFIIWELLRGYLGDLRRQDIMALLFAADRIYHLYSAPMLGGSVRGVIGAMAAGHVVVMDRYKYSSLAYQTVPIDGAPVDWEWVNMLNKYAPPPHILVYVDVDPETAISRLSLREDRHLYENVYRLDAVRTNFLHMIERLKAEPEWPRKGAPWWSLVPRAECLYPPHTRMPRIIVYPTDGGDSLEYLYQLVETAIEMKILIPENRDTQEHGCEGTRTCSKGFSGNMRE